MAEKPVSSAKGSWVKSDIKLDGKTCIITGANTGIGYVTASNLAKRGAKVILACRNLEKAEEARKKITEETKSELVSVKKLDLASLASVREFAAEINLEEERLDILVNNAGVMMCPQSKTADGFEMQMGTNHLGHFLLTNLLLDLIKKSAPSRIITVSSQAHTKFMISKIYWDDINLEKNYSRRLAYSHSKLMNVMFTKELHKRLEGTGVTTFAVHPGAVNTELARHLSTNIFMRAIVKVASPLFRTPEHGAQTSIFCAIAPEILDKSGGYFLNCQHTPGSVNPVALDPEQNERLWNLSEELVRIKETSHPT